MYYMDIFIFSFIISHLRHVDFLQENILFGEEFDEDRFNRAIKAACLEDDIRILPGGILTEIGMNVMKRTRELSALQRSIEILCYAGTLHRCTYILSFANAVH